MDLTGYRKAGFEVVALYGMVSVPHGAAGWKLDVVLYDAKQKFVRHQEKQGWTLVYQPTTQLAKPWEPTFRAMPTKGGQGLVYVPTNTGMREDHPFYQPGKDQYEVAAWFARPPRQLFLEIDDKRWERVKGDLPFLTKVE